MESIRGWKDAVMLMSLCQCHCEREVVPLAHSSAHGLERMENGVQTSTSAGVRWEGMGRISRTLVSWARRSSRSRQAGRTKEARHRLGWTSLKGTLGERSRVRARQGCRMEAEQVLAAWR